MPHAMAGFVLASVLLMLLPGPNVAQIVGNSIGNGMRAGLLTVAGAASAMGLQLGFTCLGLHAALGLAGNMFAWLRWAGVIYLIYLGLKAWNAPATSLTTPVAAKAPFVLFKRAFLVSLTNPKTLFFFSAFFPQFITDNAHVLRQMLILSISFLLIALVIDTGWALFAHHSRKLLTRHGRLQNRISGGFLITAGIGLAAARHK